MPLGRSRSRRAGAGTARRDGNSGNPRPRLRPRHIVRSESEACIRSLPDLLRNSALCSYVARRLGGICSSSGSNGSAERNSVTRRALAWGRTSSRPEDQKDRCGAGVGAWHSHLQYVPWAGQRSAFYGRQAIDLSTGYAVLPKPKRATGDTDLSGECPWIPRKLTRLKGGDGQTEAKKPVIEQMTDLAAAAAGALAESAVKAVARKAVKAVAKRAPAKNVATRVAKAARPPKKTTKKAVRKKVTKKAKKSAKKAMPRRATKKVKKKSSKKSKR